MAFMPSCQHSQVQSTLCPLLAMTEANGRFTLALCMTRKLADETWHIGCRARPRSEWQNLTACERSMMAHNQDWLEWLLSLNANGAEYVIVGGVALAHHGFPRYTGDIDVLIHATPENAARVMQALKDFGLGSLSISQDDLSRKDRVIQLGFPPGRIDLLTSIDGVSWDEVRAHCEPGSYAGAATHYISRADLIRNKRASGRPQDIADAARLEQP